MKKIVSYESLVTVLNNISSKINFVYNGANYGAMVATDGKIIIKNFKTGVVTGKKQFLSQFNTSYTPYIDIEIEEHKEVSQISHSDYKQCFITSIILEAEFLKFMQIEEFKTDYEVHKNIGLFDFDKLRKLHPNLKVRNKKNVLFFDTGSVFNISVKWDSSKGWQSVKGTKANIGAFFKAKKETSTLILTEGLKDGINANIAFPTADILSLNGKSNSYNFKVHNIDLKKYKTIIFANDRDVKEELIKMFPIQYKEHYKKTKFINWDLIEHGKDITDIIENIIIPKHKTNRDRTRSALPTLKKLLEKKSFLDEYAKLRSKEATKALKTAIEADNKDMAMRAIKTLYMFGGDLTKAVEYYLTKQNETKNNEEVDFFIKNDEKENKPRLSYHVEKITKVLKNNDKLFLNAPTGVGKSYVSLVELVKIYSNIIIISPLRMVTNEHGADETPYTNVKFDDNFGAVQADLNSNYIAVTTDAFVKLQHRYKESFGERLQKADLIIFDEQHLYYDSLGFRDETVVKCYDYLLYKYSGKTLFMSGTPILPKDISVSLITAKVLEQNKENINFYYNPFDDTKQIIESVNKELLSGSILIYVNSRAKVTELENLLQDNNIKTLSITSYWYKLNSENVDDTILNKDLGNIVYISTTKATTGVNFKHLKTIYQYGTPYTPNTLIQLMARLRSGGKYFLIEPQFTTLREQYNAKRAIGLSLSFKKMKISKVSDSFNSDNFQKWLKSFVLLSYNNKNLQGFFKTYRKTFTLIESKGLGKFNESNDDFIFIGHNVKNIDDLFEQDDRNEFRKYIEQILIDWTLKNNVELLNKYYNLSYRITNATYKISESKHQLITDNDKSSKKEKRASVKDELKELYDSIDNKLEDIKITSKILKKHGFSDTELSKLDDKKIHLKEIEKIKNVYDKITALKFHIIPSKSIFKIANELIISNGFLTVKELDTQLQKIFITNARSKAPYEKLLIETFINPLFNNSYLDFSKRKKINGKSTYNVLTISKEHKKEFEELRTKRKKEKYLKDKAERYIKSMEQQLQYISNLSESEKNKLRANYQDIINSKNPNYDLEETKELLKYLEEPQPKTPSVQELEQQLLNENISIETRAKLMHELAKIRGEIQ